MVFSQPARFFFNIRIVMCHHTADITLVTKKVIGRHHKMDKTTRHTSAIIYNVYRQLLAAILFALALLSYYNILPNQNLNHSFLILTAIYFPTALLIPLLPQKIELTGFIIDIAFLILMIHSTDGLSESLTVLTLVVVAAANILLSMRLGLLVAAVATMSVIGEQIWVSITFESRSSYTAAGLLGMAFFAVSVLVRQVSLRLQRSEAISAKQERDIARLEELNHQIVSRLRTGIIVFDQNFQVLTANPAAQRLFDHTLTDHALPNELKQAFSNWKTVPYNHPPTLKLSPQMPAMLVNFAHLHDKVNAEEQLTLVFLEDEARLTQEAQHLKLASLGRMSAIISHEIRNPLSAIQHATDLLAEEEENDSNTKLFDIIRHHVKRVNSIIGGILDLSRRQQSKSEKLNLLEQLEKARQHLEHQALDCSRIRIVDVPSNMMVRFSENQLQQIIQNLVGNALRHAGDQVNITLTAGVHERSELPWLKIRDDGKGIDKDTREHLFEPFFTTVHNGTGLGLFLCRELCESNQALLELEPETPDNTPGTSFVITFAHVDRQFQ